MLNIITSASTTSRSRFTAFSATITSPVLIFLQVACFSTFAFATASPFRCMKNLLWSTF